MSEPAAVWTPTRAFTPTPAVEALLDAQFAAYGYRVCECGATVEPPAAVCHACLTGNRRLGPLYGGSLAGPRATPAQDARIDDLLDQNDALSTENSDLARQVVALKGRIVTLEELVVRAADERDAARHALEAHAAQVRAGKGA